MTDRTSTTEALNPRSSHLDAMRTLDIVTLMNRENATVPEAIRPALRRSTGSVSEDGTFHKPIRR